MKLQFCGAARAVTGSCFKLEYEGGAILVDCGMRQGADAKGEYGEDHFPFDPQQIDTVLLTHAHIDHSGLLPLLVKRGFAGSIVCTAATEQLASIMLPDSAYIQEQDAEWHNRKAQRAGKPLVEPLYTIEDATAALKLFRPVEYGQTVAVNGAVCARYNDAGHLLGSAAIELWVEERNSTTKIVFSGDVGRNGRPIINDPTPIHGADYLVVEGTYGDREHEAATIEEKEEEFAGALRAGIARGGNIVIPSFAVGRTQELLYFIKRFLLTGRVKGLENIPVYIDSPLGIEATRIYERNARGYYDEEALEMAKSGSPFDFPTLRISRTPDESRQINFEKGTNIIISSSGMCDAGRIRHHLKHNLYRADSTILFVGYQAVGTLGRMLIDGAKKVRLFGEDIRVNAAIVRIEGFSGHAGRSELLSWIAPIGKVTSVFLVHGEETVLENFRQALTDLGHSVAIPQLGEEFALAGTELAALPVAQVAGLERLERGTGIKEQVLRIGELLEAVDDLRSPDVALKLDILEADLASLVDKWYRLLGKGQNSA